MTFYMKKGSIKKSVIGNKNAYIKHNIFTNEWYFCISSLGIDFKTIIISHHLSKYANSHIAKKS